MKYYKFLEQKITRSYIIYIILFSIITYIICAYSVSKDYTHSAETCVSYINNQVSEALTYSTNITGFLQEFPSVSEYINSPDIDSMSQNAATAINTLRTVSYSASDYLSGVALANLSTSTILTDTGSFQLDYYAQKYGLSADELRNALSSFIIDAEIRPCFYASQVEENGRTKHYLTLILCPGYGKHTTPIIYLYNLDRFLENAPGDLQKAAVTLALNGQPIHARTGYPMDNPTQELQNHLRYRTVYSSEVSTFWYDIETSYVTRYVDYIISTNNFFILFVLVLVVGLFFTLYVSKRNVRRIYAPINTVMEKLPFSSSEVTDEFASIESSISSLLSEKKTLTSIVQNYKMSLRDQFLISLIHGTLSTEEISDGLLSYDLKNVHFPLTVCVVECENYPDLAKFLDTDALCGIHTSVGYFMEQELSGAGFFQVLDLDLKSHILIMPFRGYTAMKQALLNLALKIESGLDLILKISFGEPADSFFALSKSFSDAQSLIHNVMVTSEYATVLSPNDITVNRLTAAAYSPDAESAVINRVLSCDLDNAYADMALIIDSIMGQGVFTKEQHSQLTVMLFSTFSKILSMLEKSEKEIFGDGFSIYLELKQCTTRTQMNEKIHDLMKEIILFIKASKTGTDEQTKQAMLGYIHQNYSRSISLLTLASHLNMSQFYVSKQFKALVGENFKDYLAKYRMQEAVRQFRENPNIKIKTVAENVGYNTETFSRTFSKYFGMLPNKYKDQLKKELD